MKLINFALIFLILVSCGNFKKYPSNQYFGDIPAVYQEFQQKRKTIWEEHSREIGSIDSDADKDDPWHEDYEKVTFKYTDREVQERKKMWKYLDKVRSEFIGRELPYKYATEQFAVTDFKISDIGMMDAEVYFQVAGNIVTKVPVLLPAYSSGHEISCYSVDHNGLEIDKYFIPSDRYLRPEDTVREPGWIIPFDFYINPVEGLLNFDHFVFNGMENVKFPTEETVGISGGI